MTGKQSHPKPAAAITPELNATEVSEGLVVTDRRNMESSRERVIDLIRRWQSENCLIRFTFCSRDTFLEISVPAICRARLDPVDDCAFWIQESEARDDLFYGVHVNLVAADGYEINTIPRGTHPSLQGDCLAILKVPFGDFGVLHAYEMESVDPKKLM
jgi:hypothetical protein